MAASKTPDVRVGQIWADNDPRTPLAWRRHFRVVDTSDLGGGLRARVKTVVRGVDGRWGLLPGARATTIAAHRFRPTRTGYVLVQDVEVAQ